MRDFLIKRVDWCYTLTLREVQDNDFINISIYSAAKRFQLTTTLLCVRRHIGTSHLGKLTVEQASRERIWAGEDKPDKIVTF